MHLPVSPMFTLPHSQGILYTTPSCFRESTRSLGRTKCHLSVLTTMSNIFQDISLITCLTVSSAVKIQRRHWQPLSVHLWAYCTHPTHNVNDVWRLVTPPGSTSPTLFEQWCGFFYVSRESDDKGKSFETGPTVFLPYPSRLESLTVCTCHYKGSTFFSVI